jgi:hypothetical protein
VKVRQISSALPTRCLVRRLNSTACPVGIGRGRQPDEAAIIGLSIQTTKQKRCAHPTVYKPIKRFLRMGILLELAVARFDTLRQLLVLKSDFGQVFSNGDRRRILRQSAHTSRLPTIIRAGHPRIFERRGLHSIKIVAAFQAV